MGNTSHARRCIGCKKQIPPHFEFCSVCGQDNRPPDERKPVQSCTHPNVLTGSQYCYHCGENLNRARGVWNSYDGKLQMVKGALIGSVALAVISLLILVIKGNVAFAILAVIFGVLTFVLAGAMAKTKQLADEEALPPGWHDQHKRQSADEAKSRR